MCKRHAGKERSMLAKLRLELVFTYILIVLGVLIVIVSWGYGFGSLRRPGPGLYPFFIGLFILFFSFLLLIFKLRVKSSQPLFEPGGRKIYFLMLLTFCLWIVLMPLLGYSIVTLLATYAFCKIMKLEGCLKPLALSLGTAAFIYFMFDYWLYIDLPRGILG